MASAKANVLVVADVEHEIVGVTAERRNPPAPGTQDCAGRYILHVTPITVYVVPV